MLLLKGGMRVVRAAMNVMNLFPAVLNIEYGGSGWLVAFSSEGFGHSVMAASFSISGLSPSISLAAGLGVLMEFERDSSLCDMKVESPMNCYGNDFM